ncbi:MULTISPECIES: 23S rRNA (uracil(1939)-C(5))-methyltransferase RlmD [unclassified Leptolyngbya]|uniref:23S rRNA (uracil(1939)-C(5))-methyltransferase RlmD n=1 Tax=unclassified Leptolyngbya TaxID=2650499 RepID=UPI0016839C3E|nr:MULTISPECIES: 23S rRNA (uracil(1939)-C(5))-methyltransferase RlmD [unclassified Leptolyngbya]MBD1911877.1 23S rRNA (uracil(1939)-C(5))-methyltransferase RlmD [Leptolyngbya sp. FACHB-8]MBD2156086.1 23S rRNA (uracil(1939)-C(5))-methyltransferase RlmD [Leptolyngbya sp. FACHB-16]
MESQHSFIKADSPDLWQQGSLLEITITGLNHDGAGVGRWENRVVFVPETVVGDRIQTRLVHVKPTFAHGKLHELLEESPHRIRPRCIVADKCGGCQWQHIDYAFQQETKRTQIIQDLERIGGFSNPPVNPLLPLPPDRDADLNYRNKATYPLGLSTQGHFQAGYYRKGSHHIVNLNQCPIQDNRLDPLLAEVKQDLQERGWSVYDEDKHQGTLRHLGLRIGRRTGEMLLTLVAKDDRLPGLAEQAAAWRDRYPNLVGILLNVNPRRTNAIFGPETRLIEGQPYLNETFSGLTFRVHPTTFFQVNTEQAEALVQVVMDELQLQGTERVVDAYCGIGTMTLPIAQKVGEAIALEIQPEAIDQARLNAEANNISNVTFHVGAVEKLLPTLDVKPDIVLLDPPRKGCDSAVLETLRRLQPERIAYVSCNPSTLARDLKVLCTDGLYQLTRVQPADFFPQTTHVECAAFLQRMPR